MEEGYQSYQGDVQTRVRDVEEKQRLLRDRILLLGQTLVEEREKTFKEMQEMKKMTFMLKEENDRMKEFLQRITEQLTSTARKEELMILQRQFDLFRK
ncbi:hypothetical protein KW805_02725 [Candidatus Pacearchaeota archaeon]|nr:hypothetical protein [Candidatus Pacearchaeota archaeon]